MFKGGVRAKEKCRESKRENGNKLMGLSRHTPINNSVLPSWKTCIPLGFCRDIMITTSAGFCSMDNVFVSATSGWVTEKSYYLKSYGITFLWIARALDHAQKYLFLHLFCFSSFPFPSIIVFIRFTARAPRRNLTSFLSTSSDLHAPSSERGCGRNCLCGRVGDYMGVEMYEGPAACTYQNPLDLKRGLLSHNLQNKAQGEWRPGTCLL